ncbi:EthD family reductase [soil metagenome]
MVKLIALYKTPADKEGFDEKYFKEHVPLVEKMPGLVKTEIAKLKGLGESKYYMQAEMYFNDMDSLNEAMASPEGKASARQLMTFAKEIVEMHIGNITE